MNWIVTALLLLVSSMAVATEVLDQMKKCAAIKDTADRLVCYDRLSKDTGAAPESKIDVGTGEWIVLTTTSKIDDSTNVTLIVRSSDKARNRFGRENHLPLYIECRENRTLFYVSWDTFVGSESIEVLHRFDSEKAVRSDWSISTDHTATFRRNPIPFIREATKHQSLLLSLTPFGGNPTLVTFPIAGLDANLAPLQKACHW